MPICHRGNKITAYRASRAIHRAGLSATQWRRMAFPLLDEDKKAASSRHIGPAVA